MREEWPPADGEQVFRLVLHPAMAEALVPWLMTRGWLTARDAEADAQEGEMPTYVVMTRPA